MDIRRKARRPHRKRGASALNDGAQRAAELLSRGAACGLQALVWVEVLHVDRRNSPGRRCCVGIRISPGLRRCVPVGSRSLRKLAEQLIHP
jgi:hypothetical protein